MRVYDYYGCRLGNGLFRYMASTLFCIIFGATRTYDAEDVDSVICDDIFRSWAEHYMHTRTVKGLPRHLTYGFRGFFQTDVYIHFKEDLRQWIREHPDDTVISDVDHHNTVYSIGELFATVPANKRYTVVIHLRLEDYVQETARMVIRPDAITRLLDKLGFTNICIVCNAPTTDLEHTYINYIAAKYDTVIETNDVVTDFQIMRNAEVLVCSGSTLSWVAAFFSNAQIYFPQNRFTGWTGQTFCTPSNTVVYYENELCTMPELEQFLSV